MRKFLINLLLKTKKSNTIKRNIYKTQYNRKVLISYDVYKFIKQNTNHTNYYESHIIAKVFSNLKYDVDIINFDNNVSMSLKEYEIIFGFGTQFENSFYTNQKALRIYYATYAHICHQNYIEIERVKSFNLKYNTKLLPKRIVPNNWSLSTNMSNALIIIGNSWTKKTYSKHIQHGIPVYTQRATALHNNKDFVYNRELSHTMKNFLWFGSGGLIHKGLDLCLEFFSKNPEFTLHICGSKENDFFKVFQEELKLNNILYHGFIDVKSDKFNQIVSNCTFTLLPTCSEGQNTSLLTCMNTGLIPISTNYSGIDMQEYGLLIESLTSNSLEKSIQQSQLLSEEEVLNLSDKVMTYVKTKHSLESFENDFKKTLKEILSK